MYVSDLNCGCSNNLRGLGEWEAMIPLIASMMAQQGESGGMADGGRTGSPALLLPPQTTAQTSTSVNTQVSPQISPSFVQQSSPSNSPVSTGAVMSLPGTPITGAIPGIDTTNPYAPQPGALQYTGGVNTQYVVLGAIGLVGVALIMKRKKRAQ